MRTESRRLAWLSTIASVLIAPVPAAAQPGDGWRVEFASYLVSPQARFAVATGVAQIPGVGGTTWVLSSLPGRSLIAGVSITLRFAGDRATGSDGCNRFTASYTVTAASFSIGPPAASTQMACPDPVSAQAAAFMDVLMRARSHRIAAGQLQLLGPDGAVLATLAPQPATLAGTKWQVTGYNNGKQAVTSVDRGTTVTMVFGTDGRVSGSAGCNAYTGPYTMDGTKLTFGPIATTRRICPAPEHLMEQEQQFLKALASVATARIEGTDLELRSAEGALAITLRRESSSD